MPIESAFPQEFVKPFVVAVVAPDPFLAFSSIGSGILLHHQNNIFLLTAAHNFFEDQDGQEKLRNDLRLTIGNRPPIKISIPEEAIINSMDIAMVPLNDNTLINESGRPYPVSSYTVIKGSGEPYSVSSYPLLHPVPEETRPLTIYGFIRLDSGLATLEIDTVDYNLDGKDDPRILQDPSLRENCFNPRRKAPSYDLVYTTSTRQLQGHLSGSPIIPNTGGQVLVFGIHQSQCSDKRDNSDNQGTGISSEEIAKLFNLDVSGSGVDTPQVQNSQVQNSQVQDFSETEIAPKLKYPVEVTW